MVQFQQYLFNCINELKGDPIHGNAIDLSYGILAKLPSHGFGLYSYPIPNRTDWIDVESPVYAERNADLVKNILAQMEVMN